METLYAKLYDKYSKLKERKESEMEQLSHEQEMKFVKYVSAADELIEHLRDENNRLHAQNNELRSEVASMRSAKDEQYAEYQINLMEENLRNRELSVEIERLQYRLQEAVLCSSRAGKNEDLQLDTPGISQVSPGFVSNCSTREITRKRIRHSGDASDEVDETRLRTSANNISMGVIPSGAAVDIQQSECCRRSLDSSGADVSVMAPPNCLFHAFSECLAGMKLSTINQIEGKCISALHQSSGYSFSLTWVSKAGGEEVELLYRVLSLGTFERVAPGWMGEELMFSLSMFPLFFQRISRVIKLDHCLM